MKCQQSIKRPHKMERILSNLFLPPTQRTSRTTRSRPMRWNLFLLLFVIVTHFSVVMGQDEEQTISPAPSTVMDTSMPSLPIQQTTQTPTDSPGPSHAPSATPTDTQQPSFSPTISFEPTVSDAPSTAPTVSAMPTASPQPSFAPTLSATPSFQPTATPSAMPSTPIPILVAEAFNNRMIFDGLPFPLMNLTVPGTNMTLANDTYCNITSEHVITFWRARNYTQFNISGVVTLFDNQFPEPSDGISTAFRSRVIYDQQIRYMSWGPDSPVFRTGENSSVLFIWPFQADSQSYVDRLMKAFENLTDDRIYMLEISQSRNQPSEVPTPAPAAPIIPPQNDKMDTPIIVAVVLGTVAAVGLILFVIIWYITRRQPDVMFNEDIVDPGDGELVPPPNEDPRVIMPGQYSMQQQLYAQQPQAEQSLTGSASVDNVYIEDDEKGGGAVGAFDDQDGSLHVGVPLEGDIEGDSMEDDEDDDDSYYYPQQDALRDSVIEANRPSLTAFGLQISELEE